MFLTIEKENGFVGDYKLKVHCYNAFKKLTSHITLKTICSCAQQNWILSLPQIPVLTQEMAFGKGMQ